MLELLTSLKEWFFSLGANYGVNPLIFGSIYVGAIPFFTLSVAWLVRNYRKNRSILPPAISAGFFFISAYLYLLIAGRNVPAWVYAVLVSLVAVSAYTTLRKIRKRLNKQRRI